MHGCGLGGGGAMGSFGSGMVDSDAVGAFAVAVMAWPCQRWRQRLLFDVVASEVYIGKLQKMANS